MIWFPESTPITPELSKKPELTNYGQNLMSFEWEGCFMCYIYASRETKWAPFPSPSPLSKSFSLVATAVQRIAFMIPTP